MTAPVLVPLTPAQAASGRWKATVFYRAQSGQLVDLELEMGSLVDLPIKLFGTDLDLTTIAGICIQPIEQGEGL